MSLASPPPPAPFPKGANLSLSTSRQLMNASSSSAAARTLPPAMMTRMATSARLGAGLEPLEILGPGSTMNSRARVREHNSPYLANGNAAAKDSLGMLKLDTLSQNGHSYPDPRSSQQSVRTVDTVTTARTLTRRLLTPLGGGPGSGNSAGSGGGPLRTQPSFTLPRSSARSIAESEFSTTSTAVSTGTQANPSYGYTYVGLEVELDSTRVAQLVFACGEQIRQRGLDTPLIFSSMALDLSPQETASLIRCYLSLLHSTSASNTFPYPTYSRTQASSPIPTPPAPDAPLPAAFAQDIRFANPNDLAAIIKWAMSRLGKVLAVPIPVSEPNRKGDVQEETAYVQQRGFLDLDIYMQWRDEERRNRYPAIAFSRFLRRLEPDDADLLLALFSLLSSTTSYSLKNGMTPSRLARLFGPLLFGLPEDETFQRTYDAYVRDANATEHLLLAYIREQATKEALPTRLVDHITGYPAMLSSQVAKLGSTARSVPVTIIEANVRSYSPELLQVACQMELQVRCEEWEACRGDDPQHGLYPQFSDRFRKLINYRGGLQGLKSSGVPPVGPLSEFGLRSPDPNDALNSHSSLVSKAWGDFANIGFLETDSSKLAFDLKETERKNRSERRGTKIWSDFASSGFGVDGDDAGLDSVLSFDDQLKEELERWPNGHAEILERMRKSARKVPDFSYDTRAKVISSPSLTCTIDGNTQAQGQAAGADNAYSKIDETFAEVWADYMLGCGWSNRDELSHRTANFVVVQYKSRPTPWSVSSQSNNAGAQLPTSIVSPIRSEFGDFVQKDPRTDAAWFVISEIVPPAYRADLEALGRKKGRSKPMLRKLNVFKKLGKGKQEKNLPFYDPDDVFQPGSGGQTKQLKFNDPVQRTLESDRSTWATFSQSPLSPLQESYQVNVNATEKPLPASAPAATTSHPAVHHIKLDVELPTKERGGLISVLRSRSQRMRGRKSVPQNLPPAVPPKSPLGASFSRTNGNSQQNGHDQSSSTVDFETRSLYEVESPRKEEGSCKRHAQKQSRDDVWVDVMLKSQGRIATQGAIIPPPRDSSKPMGSTADFSCQELADSVDLSLKKSRSRSPSGAELPVDNVGGKPTSDLFLGFNSALSSVARCERPMSDLSESPQVAYLREDEVETANKPTEPPAVAPFNKLTSDSPDPVVPESAMDIPVSSFPEKVRLTPLQPHATGGSISNDPLSPAAGLRARLNPVDLPPKAAAISVKTEQPTRAAIDNPFDINNRIHGRVAKIAGQFGGPPAKGSGSTSGSVSRAADEKAQKGAEGKQTNAPALTDENQSADQSAESKRKMHPLEAAAAAALEPHRWQPHSDQATDAGDNSTDAAEQREEDDIALPMSFREPYQPGQPLHSLLEADEAESVRSGSTNSRRL
ncbi:hypothetical protein K437DRAFT_258204 [Tilletiaria anomala UBC 951]|uniref:Meiotically up-regulated protein Msb1/Mug8 domain-containing protein n=1 Tax=Tilletiaria anomala (strain ATCC 24038 / CBS 436.72 / UBC 951) TaxID=1037660 RepID=A0A066VMU1_TILAU|nr:uncharacterized protein K437DRAFT_258204 [Tilletiaria anomala UBC 951]KDN41608.1 hypothetical protein K437DRAFT_258204 [Tilletiaria anomala UBC 951]